MLIFTISDIPIQLIIKFGTAKSITYKIYIESSNAEEKWLNTVGL